MMQRSVYQQKQDAYLINESGKQRTLSQTITKLVFSIDDKLNDTVSSNTLNALEESTAEFENSHSFLIANNNENAKNTTIDSLLRVSEVFLQKIITSSKNISNNPNSEFYKRDLNTIAEAEPSYLITMDLLVNEYQKDLERNLGNLKLTLYFLAIISALLLIGEYLFVLAPGLKQLFRRNKELTEVNNELSISENKLKENMLELKKLKTDLETKEAHNRIFIEQAPTAIAMLDNNMCYIAVSQRWITDYKMEGQEIIGRSHYDLFPEIGDDWKENHQKCLKGAIDVCDEAPFERDDGSVQWIYWDVRPWYISEGNIGGLLMHTGDITHIKEKEEEKKRIEEILDKTNEVARIGTWELDLVKNKVFWSKIVCDIHEVPEGYLPNLETGINFYKEGKSRETIKKAVQEAIEHGTAYDVEVELITAKGAEIWTRAIGQAEMEEGKCTRLFGVFQDIDKMKRSQLALDKAHSELQAIFNSGPIALVSTDNNGIINHFNYGAELLLGYSAAEMIGLKAPECYHIEEELDKFRIDIAAMYDADPKGFDPYTALSKNDQHDTREWTYRRKDGSTFPVQLTLTAIKNEVGEKVGFLGVSFDITERKKTKDELLKKNQLLNFAEEISMMGNWQWDLTTNKLKWSTNLYKIFGVKENTDLTIDTYFDFVHPEDKVRINKNVQESINGKLLSDIIHRIKLKNGTVKTIRLLAVVSPDSDGKVSEIVGTCQDITQLQMAENKFRGLLESAPDAMVIVNERREIQLINKQAEKLFGYSAEELVGEQVDILIPERFNNTDLKIKVINDAKESVGLNKNGKEIPVQISFSPLQTEEGLLVSAAIRDITTQKLAETELLRKNQLLNFAEEITLMGNWQWNIVADEVRWSHNLYNIFNLDKEIDDLSFDTYFSFVHPDDKDLVTEHFTNATEGKGFENFAHRIITNGKTKTIQLLGEVVTNDKGEVIEMIGTCQDVTEQKMAENKFRGLLESAPDAMVIVNDKGKIQLINKQAEKLFGYTAVELLEKSVETLIPKRYTGNHKGHRSSFFANPKVRAMGVGQETELFGINKDGKEIPIQISLSPLRTEEGILVSAAIRDITDQKIAQNKIIQAKEKLEVLTHHLSGQNEQLANFAHITSHNLRSPVSNLNALLHLYKLSESEEERKLLFDKFEVVIGHLTSTLNTLIEALKTKKEGAKSLELMDFEEVLSKTKEIITGQIIKTNAIITSDFSKIPKIEYHKTYLESIFLNLVTNALKYRSPNRNPELHIKTEYVGDKIKLTFQDNGLGIDLKKNGHKLFGLYKTFHRHPEAKGVGLYLTKIQIETMGGSITAISEEDKGSTFIVIF